MTLLKFAINTFRNATTDHVVNAADALANTDGLSYIFEDLPASRNSMTE